MDGHFLDDRRRHEHVVRDDGVRRVTLPELLERHPPTKRFEGFAWRCGVNELDLSGAGPVEMGDMHPSDTRGVRIRFLIVGLHARPAAKGPTHFIEVPTFVVLDGHW